MEKKKRLFPVMMDGATKHSHHYERNSRGSQPIQAAGTSASSQGKVVRAVCTPVSHARGFQASAASAEQQATITTVASPALDFRAADDDLDSRRFDARAIRDRPRLLCGLPRE